jgi:hypothetical protein
MPNLFTKLWQRWSQRPSPEPDDEREWESLPAGPSRRLDAGGIQIGHVLYCFAGYEAQERVISSIDPFDLAGCVWTDRIAMPSEVPQSHFALSCEADRYVYFAAGQLGPRCSPAVANVFVWDRIENSWASLPSLPEARYSPTMQFLGGRLHLIGGSKPDRYTPVADHLSLGVSDGKALDAEWQIETPIPRAGMHRASAVVNDRLFVLGGQEGDFVPVPGDPEFSCDGNTIEVVYPDLYEWSEAGKHWIRLPDMPVPSSHIEYSVVIEGDLIFILGGSCFKDPKNFSIELTDVIQVFDTRTESWSVSGKLPYRVKCCVAASYEGWLYATSGQRDVDAGDPRPGAIENSTWRSRLVPGAPSRALPQKY